MIYYSVGNRCAVDFAEMRLPIPLSQVLEILKEKGFQEVEVNLVEIARKLVGVSEYRRGARPNEAPQIVDCSSLIVWLYGQKGIWLPRLTIQQREFGTQVNTCRMRAGDLVFTSGYKDHLPTDQTEGVGHVGMATNDETVIHAAGRLVGVIESSLQDFIGEKELRGRKRIIPDNSHIFTFITPDEQEIEWSDDIRWIILESLS